VESCSNGQGAGDEIRRKTKVEESSDQATEDKKIMRHQHLQRTSGSSWIRAM
jgi:hypothetical protein